MSNTGVQRELVSVIIPCFNEEEVIETTYHRLIETLGRLPDTDFEWIFVDDGSYDRTPSILRHIQARDPRARALFFSRNFGHQMAVTAGIEHAAGDAVVLIDADLDRKSVV